MLKIQAGGINPTLLGVPERWVDMPPTPSRFPPKFNPDAQYVWVGVLDSDEYAAATQGAPNTVKWGVAVHMYLVAARLEELDAFTRSNTLGSADNGEVLSFLQRARRKIVKWFDGNGLMELFIIRKVKREVTMTENGFVLDCWARAEYEGDRMQLDALLRDKYIGLQPVPSEKGRVLTKMLNPFVWISVSFKAGRWVTLHYRIVVNHRFYHPKLQEGTSVGKTELMDWVDRMLWLPQVRLFKFKIQNRKSQF